MIAETDVELADGRVLHVYDAPPGDGDVRLTIVWHHGSPNVGSPPEPLFPEAGRLGVRWVGYDRPGYGGSTANPGRTVGSAAVDVARVADALGIERFAVMGHSGGGAHALACGALLPDRLLGVVCASGLAPFDAEGLDWFAGFGSSGEGELRAATRGAADLETYLATTEFDPEQFTPEDHAALAGPWAWLLTVVRRAMVSGLAPMVDDDLAAVAPWGFDVETIRAPVLYLHGGKDRMVPPGHAEWLAAHTPSAQLWLRPEDGHVSVLAAAEDAMRWLVDHAAGP